MKKSNIVASLIIFLLVLIGISFKVVIATNNNASINATEVTLWYLSDTAKEHGVSIPDDYLTEYKLEVSGTNIIPTYTLSSGAYVYLKLSEDGKITPTGEGRTTATVDAWVGNEHFYVTVNVKDYLDEWIENEYEKYIAENITSTMSDYEKMEKICDYVVQFDYGTSPDYRYYPLIHSGDCIASSHTIIKMSEMLGIKAYERYDGDKSGGLLSNHRNVSAILDGKVYTVEAGYNESAPRSYDIEEEPDGFRFGWIAQGDEPALLQYDGFEEDVIVPDTFTREFYDGPRVMEVKSIADSAFSFAVTVGGQVIKTVTLPNHVEKIYDNAFDRCKDLTTVNIPATLYEIGESAFEDCENLTQLNISPDNPNFTFEGGILYNKDKSEVILCTPGTEGKVVLDKNVKKIRKRAFYRCRKVTSVELGPNVQEIGEEAFKDCSIRGINIPASVKTVEKNAFNNAYIQTLIIEDGCNANFAKSSFFTCSYLTAAIIPPSIKNLSPDVFTYCNNVVYYVEANSYAYNWVTENNKKYEIIDTNSNEILSSMIVLKEDYYTYDGTEKRPEILVLYGGKELKRDVDYTVKYENNITAISPYAKVVVTGKGQYSGTAEKQFNISSKESDFTISVSDIKYGEDINLELIENNAGCKLAVIKYNTTKNINGATTQKPTEVGTYYVYVSATPRDYNYTSRIIWAKFNILQADNILEISCSDVRYGDLPQVKVITNKSGGELTYYYKKQTDPDSKYTTDVPTELGAYTVKAVSKETHNYKEGIATANFEIKEIVFLKGDVDKSGVVDAVDASKVLTLFKNQNATEEELYLGDVDGTPGLSAVDAMAILTAFKNDTPL